MGQVHQLPTGRPGTGPLWKGRGLWIAGTGSYLPRTLVRNDGSAGTQGSRVDEAVLGSISVRTRHVSAEDETIPMMGAQAARQALATAAVDPTEIDLLVLSNWTTPAYTPDHAPSVAALLGCPRAFAFDVSTACLGFVHAMQLAAMYLEATGTSTAVIVSSEQFSQRVRPGSKGALVTADGAGAAVLRRGPGSGGPGLIDSIVSSDGDRAEVIVARPPLGHVRSQKSLPEEAVASITAACSELLSRNGMTMDDVDYVVPHPGTDVVHRRVQGALGIPDEKFKVNLERVGNTSSASIPLMLQEMCVAGALQPDDVVLSPAIGAGWYSGAMLYGVG